MEHSVKRTLRFIFICCILPGILVVAHAQKPRQPRNKKAEESGPVLPNDERLLSLHVEFVNKARKLAAEYERRKEIDKAKVVYKEILKLVPKYKVAQDKLSELREQEATAKRTVITVAADKPWQNTGVKVIKGKPIRIRAQGTWTFTLTAELDANGMAIPKELQKFKLGSLLGVVRPIGGTPAPPSRKRGDKENKGPLPFEIGAEHTFVAKETGYLYVCMYDNNHSDNRGVVKIEIQGTFEK